VYAALSHVSLTWHSLLPVAPALILVTPCSDDSVRYYFKCGSGRIKLGAKVLNFVSGYTAS